MATRHLCLKATLSGAYGASDETILASSSATGRHLFWISFLDTNRPTCRYRNYIRAIHLDRSQRPRVATYSSACWTSSRPLLPSSIVGPPGTVLQFGLCSAIQNGSREQYIQSSGYARTCFNWVLCKTAAVCTYTYGLEVGSVQVLCIYIRCHMTHSCALELLTYILHSSCRTL